MQAAVSSHIFQIKEITKVNSTDKTMQGRNMTLLQNTRLLSTQTMSQPRLLHYLIQELSGHWPSSRRQQEIDNMVTAWLVGWNLSDWHYFPLRYIIKDYQGSLSRLVTMNHFQSYETNILNTVHQWGWKFVTYICGTSSGMWQWFWHTLLVNLSTTSLVQLSTVQGLGMTLENKGVLVKPYIVSI